MKVLVYLAFINLFLCNCSSSKKEPYEKIVLQVGKLQFTSYEVEKNMNLYRNTFLQKTGRQPGESELKQWQQEFEDRAYLLADAYQKGYDTMAVVYKKVAAMACFVISQPGGLFEQKLLSDSLTITDSDVDKAMKRCNKQLEVKYLKFNNYDTAMQLLGKSQLKNNADFEKAVQKCAKSPHVVYKSEVLRWPLLNFWEKEDYLDSLNKGDVTPLLAFRDGYYVMLAVGAVKTEPNSDPVALKARLVNILKSQKREKILYQKKQAILSGAQIKYNKEFLASIAKNIASMGKVHEFDKAQLAPVLNQIMLWYQTEGSETKVPFHYFIDYYNNLPMRYTIANEGQLRSVLDAMVLQDNYYRKAHQLGMTQQPKFALDKDNYRKGIVYSMYEGEEIKKHIKISDKEISNYYYSNIEQYKQATQANVTLYILDANESALSLLGSIRRGMNDDSKLAAIKGLRSIRHHVSISYADKGFPDTIKRAIFNSKVREACLPIQIEGKYYVACKEDESGSRIRELNEVKALIRKQIEDRKLKQAKALLVQQLKMRYPVTDNIDIHQYKAQSYVKD